MEQIVLVKEMGAVRQLLLITTPISPALDRRLAH
jgi:hypothetical protein